MPHDHMDARLRITGCLWGAVVGDALGFPVEFRPGVERDGDPVTGKGTTRDWKTGSSSLSSNRQNGEVGCRGLLSGLLRYDHRDAA